MLTSAATAEPDIFGSANGVLDSCVVDDRGTVARDAFSATDEDIPGDARGLGYLPHRRGPAKYDLIQEMGDIFFFLLFVFAVASHVHDRDVMKREINPRGSVENGRLCL